MKEMKKFDVFDTKMITRCKNKDEKNVFFYMSKLP